ncbi:MAG: ABC-2 family transporter protein [Elusimicrobia bacterium]|nr:ABC-2 family transporter protein [Elusimicrobiota bacterium]
MKKYFYVFSLSLQQAMQHRASLLMDRVRSVALLLSLYFLWSALMQNQDSFLGYSRTQMLSYVLCMNLLRAFVLSTHAWDMVGEISSGRISSYLLRPIRYFGFCLARDFSQKVVFLGSALLEVFLLLWCLRATVYFPGSWRSVFFFFVAVWGAFFMYFFLAFLVSSLAFWTSESAGPLFCFELLLQFTAGVFFPLDVLPPYVQGWLHVLPFPYLIYFPLSIYLEKLPLSSILHGFMMQGVWMVILGWVAAGVWRKGLRVYMAEGG